MLTTDVEAAATALAGGGLVAIPTETVYGLAADADNPAAVARVYAVKGRPPTHPVIVHIAGADAIDAWAREVPAYARALARAHWPGPLTLVLRRSSRAGDHVTGGAPTIGLRCPAHPLTHALLARFGGGLAAPSANRFGRVSPTTAQHVLDELGGLLDPARDLVLDGGACPIGVESTIVDATGQRPRLLRPGAVDVVALTATTGLEVDRTRGTTPAPGTLPSHYAPSARVVLAEDAEAPAALAAVLADLAPQGTGAAGTPGSLTGGIGTGTGAYRSRVGLLALASVTDPGPAVQRLAAPRDVEEYAQQLYDALRRADVLGLDVVVAVLPSDEGIGTAVRDRLRRAAT